MTLQCPRCQSTFAFEGQPPREVVCPSCGSSVITEPGGTAVWLPGEAPRRLGKFTLLEQVGVGSFGTVYKARDTELDRVVAVKVPRAGSFPEAEEMERFLREARSAAQLKHPGIVALHDAGTIDGVCCLVSEFIEGATLAERLTARRFGFRQSAELLAEVADALQYAHEHGVVHRDLKPSNVLLDLEGRSHLMDFGLAKRAADAVSMTLEGQILGTPAYMAPEQARGEVRKVDARSDVYSLGVILYELLTGELPFRGQTRMLLVQVIQDEPRPPRRLNDRIPRDLETICLKAMAKEPARRYPSAGELADDLRRFLRGEPIRARPVGPVERSARWCRRNPLVAGLSGAVVVLLLAGSVTSTALAILANERAEEAGRRARAEAAATAEARRAQEQAEADRDAKARALERAEGLRLTAYSANALPANPTLALLLAIEGARRGPRGAAHNNALLAALRDCHELRACPVSGGPVKEAAFSADGRRLFTVGREAAGLWDVASGRLLRTFSVPGLSVKAARLSPDGKRVVVVSEGAVRVRLGGGAEAALTDRAVRVWDAEDGREVAVLRGHEDRVVAAEFSPDGARVVTVSWDRTARVWDAATGKELAVLRGHTCALLSAVFSPDGASVLTVSTRDRPRSRLPGWPALEKIDATDPPLGPGIPELLEQAGLATSSVSLGGEEGMVRLWDGATGKEVRRFQKAIPGVLLGQKTKVPTLAVLSPDGRSVVTPFTDGSVSQWDAASGKELAPLAGQAGSARLASYSPDGRLLVTVSGDTDVRVWEAASGMEVAVLKGHGGLVHAAAFSPDGQRLVTASADHTARLWDAGTGRPVAVLKGHEGEVFSARFGPDGRQVVTASADLTVRLWDAAARESYEQVLAGHAGPVRRARFGPDGRQVVTASADKTARLWDARTGRATAVLQGHAEQGNPKVRDFLVGEVLEAELSADGRRVLTVSADRRGTIGEVALFGGDEGPGAPVPFTPVRLWDAATGKERLGLKGPACQPRLAALGPDGRVVLTVPADLCSLGRINPSGITHRVWQVPAGDGSARVWDAETGAELASLRPEDGPFLHALFSPDGRHVLAIDSAHRVYHWDWRARRVVARWSAGRAVTAVAVSPDGRRLAAGSPDGSARVWEIATGRERAALTGHRGPVTAIAFRPDGRLVATASADHTARLWDGDTGVELAVLGGHERPLRSVAFSPDGGQVVSASADHTARVWEAADGRELFTLTGHRGAVEAAEFSPDGTRVLTASADGTARIWPLDPLPLALARKPRDLTAGERERLAILPPPR